VTEAAWNAHFPGVSDENIAEIVQLSNSEYQELLNGLPSAGKCARTSVCCQALFDLFQNITLL